MPYEIGWAGAKGGCGREVEGLVVKIGEELATVITRSSHRHSLPAADEVNPERKF